MIIVNIEIKETHFCRSDLRIATKLTDSQESKFPPTNHQCIIVKSKNIFTLRGRCGFMKINLLIR